MMHHTRALIIRQDSWGEADLLVTALTPDFGKIRLRAQGVRKHGAKLQGHLEPGALAEISFVIGRNGYRLTTARLLAFPVASRISLAKLRGLAGILGAIEANVLEERERAAELFAAAAAAVTGIEGSAHLAALRQTYVWFHVRLLALLGLLPSPHSREAAAIGSLLGVAMSKVADCERFAPPEVLEREFVWLVEHLGDAVRVPVAALWTALY